MTGKGTSGSWRIRGEQLGRAIGATVQPMAESGTGFDLAVIVKRPPPQVLMNVRVPLIWDVVDAYPQPAALYWDRNACMAWLDRQMKVVRPVGVVAATKQMAQDLEPFGVPVLFLPHHARPGMRLNPLRPEVEIVGYEGAEHYLGHWGQVVRQECNRRGWTFVVNPAELAEVDILVALRAMTGYAPRQWKSGVKLANAQGSGTPIVCNREAGSVETQSGAERWADTPEELAAAFDALAPLPSRLHAARRLHSYALSLESVASVYEQWLRSNF